MGIQEASRLGDAAEPTPDGRAADTIVAALAADIASGALADQSPLPSERELMTRFGASRTVIREAISTLAGRGLLENRPRFRPVVRKPDYTTVLRAAGDIVRHLVADRDGIANLYRSRVFLERALVREAATAARKTDIVALQDALAANRAAIGDSEAFYRTDVAFHGALYRVPDNPIFPAIHQGYVAWLAPHWKRMPRSPERNTVNFRAHEAILAAIVERDPDAAEEALANHLRSAWEYVRATFTPEAT